MNPFRGEKKNVKRKNEKNHQKEKKIFLDPSKNIFHLFSFGKVREDKRIKENINFSYGKQIKRILLLMDYH